MLRKSLAVILLAASGYAPATAQAWGIPGCANLPQYNRALGALQGMTSACDMSVEEARRVVAAHDGLALGPAAGAESVGPPARLHRRHRGWRAHRAVAHGRRRTP